MAHTYGDKGDKTGADAPKPIVFAGRVKKRAQGVFQLELVDGLTVDVREEDCDSVDEATDPITLRPTVTVRLKGDKPITATVQPHFFRVLSASGQVPFVFTGAKSLPAGDFVLGLAYVSTRAPGGGGGGTPHHQTTMYCTNWLGMTQEDGTKGDSAGEPDEIYLP
jgi:hypothetical protein